MAQIKIRGLGKVVTDEQTASAIKRDLEADQLGAIVKISPMVTVKGKDIEAVWLDDPFADSPVWQQTEDEYLSYRRRRLNWTAAQKAANLEFFKFIYYLFTGRPEVPPEIISDIIAQQEKFFQENPSRIFCDPKLFKPFVPHNSEAGEGQTAYWRLGGLRLVEQTVTNDLFYADKTL
jgi:hypothetical protein